MSDEEDKRLAPGNRTIQVDALTDVELIESAAAEAAAAEEGAPAAPPPLPPRTSLPAAKPEAKPAGVPWLAIAITVVVTGTLGALGAHFLVPAAAPPETPTPPAATPAPTAPAAPAEVRRVTLEDEVIISAESPDAGLAAPE